MSFNNSSPFNNMPSFNTPSNNGPSISTPSPDLNKIYKDATTEKPKFYEGYGGAKCSQSDVAIGTYQSNNLGENPKSGGAVSNVLGGKLNSAGWKFDCSADNITGEYKGN